MRDKAITLIDEQSRRFLEAATFFLLATTAADGSVDVSPRGEPADVLTEECVRAVFGLDSQVIIDPTSAKPLMLPIGRHHMVS